MVSSNSQIFKFSLTTDIIRLLYSEEYTPLVMQAGNRQRESWKIVNELRGVKKKKCCENSKLTPDNLNNYYVTVAYKLSYQDYSILSNKAPGDDDVFINKFLKLPDSVGRGN